MGLSKKRKCRNCGALFRPDPRNTKRQKYCSKQECRQAGKKASQRRRLEKPENKNYFRGPDNVERVRRRRDEHPKYWRRSSSPVNALQETLCTKPSENIGNIAELKTGALQDVLTSQPAVLIGLTADITDTALQDNIAETIRRMEQLGRDIICQPINEKGDVHGIKNPCQPGTDPPDPETIQLGRPSPGP